MLENALAELARTPIAAIGGLASAVMLFLSLALAYVQLKQRRPVETGVIGKTHSGNLAFRDVTSVLLVLMLAPGVTSGFALLAWLSFQLGLIAGTIATAFLFVVCVMVVSLFAGALLSDWLIHRALGDGELARWIASEDKRKARNGRQTKQGNRLTNFFMGWGVFFAVCIVTVFWIFLAEHVYALLVAQEATPVTSELRSDLHTELSRYASNANDSVMAGMVLVSYLVSGTLGGVLSATFFFVPIESKIRAEAKASAPAESANQV